MPPSTPAVVGFFLAASKNIFRLRNLRVLGAQVLLKFGGSKSRPVAASPILRAYTRPMRPHDQQRFAEFIADFVERCGIEPPFHLVAIGSNGAVSVSHRSSGLSRCLPNRLVLFGHFQFGRQRGDAMKTAVNVILSMSAGIAMLSVLSGCSTSKHRLSHLPMSLRKPM